MHVRWDIVALMVTMPLLVVAVLLDLGALRLLAALLHVLFVPGYLLTYALLPLSHPPEWRQSGSSPPDSRYGGGLAPLERLVLAVGLSIVLCPFAGVLLWIVGAPVHLEPLMWTLLGLEFLILVVALYRLPPPTPAPAPADGPATPVALVAVLSALALGAAATIGWIVLHPPQDPAFTELYLRGPLQAECLPNAYSAETGYAIDRYGCEPFIGGNATLGLVNHEHREVVYRLRSFWTLEGNGSTLVRSWTVSLPAVPYDAEAETTPVQHEEPLELPPPPGTGTMRFTVQATLEGFGPLPADPSRDVAYRQVSLVIRSV